MDCLDLSLHLEDFDLQNPVDFSENIPIEVFPEEVEIKNENSLLFNGISPSDCNILSEKHANEVLRAFKVAKELGKLQHYLLITKIQDGFKFSFFTQLIIRLLLSFSAQIVIISLLASTLSCTFAPTMQISLRFCQLT